MKKSKVIEMEENISIKVLESRPFVSMIADVTYSQVAVFGFPNVDLRMDIIRPVSQKLLPGIVFIPGGRFVHANKNANIQSRLRIAEAGYIVASIEFRTMPLSGFPDPIEDVKTAVRYLKKNAARFGIDSDRIIVWGESAGGYLACMAGATNGSDLYNGNAYPEQNSDICAVIECFGVTDAGRIMPDFTHEDPLRYVSGKTPPFLIMHGKKDKIVPYQESVALSEKLRNKGVSTELYLIDNAEHGGPAWQQPVIIQLIIDFLKEYVK